MYENKNVFMPSTLKKLEGRIAFGSCSRPSVRVYVTHFLHFVARSMKAKVFKFDMFCC